MNVLIGRSKRNSFHVHSNWNELTFIWATIHHLVFDQCLSLCLCCCPCSKCLFSHESYLHTLDFNLDKMEVDSSNDDILEMIKRFIILKVNVKTVLNTNFHLHWNYFSSSFNFLIRKQHCKVSLFNNIELSSNYNSDEVSNSTSDSLKSFILFLEIRESEFKTFILA